MRSLDDYLCDQVQSLSDWLQDLTGKTCYWWACLCVCLDTGLSLFRYIYLGRNFAFAAIAVVCAGFNLYWISRMEVTFKGEMANPLRHHPNYSLWRYFMVGVVAFNALDVVVDYAAFGISPENLLADKTYLAGSIAGCLWAYFISCTPKPGSPYKAGKWIDALAKKLFGQPQGA